MINNRVIMTNKIIEINKQLWHNHVIKVLMKSGCYQYIAFCQKFYIKVSLVITQ